MKRRDFIIGTLVKAGFRTSMRGFEQFCDSVELYADERSSTMRSIYSRVAEKYGSSASAVEKNVGRLLSTASAREVMGDLFGIRLADVGSKEIISLFSNYVELCGNVLRSDHGALQASRRGVELRKPKSRISGYFAPCVARRSTEATTSLRK